MTIANCSQKCGINVNQTSVGKEATEFSIAKDN
jgi:hypothetical protein